MVGASLPMIDCNGGEIGLDAIGDGDVVVEGEGFAVSEELEGGYAGVKVPVEDCGVCGRIDDGVRADVEEVIEDDLMRAGSVLVPAEPVKELLALTTLEVSRSSTVKVPVSVSLDVGLIEASAFLEGSVDGSASDGGSVIGAGDIDCNGGEIGLDAIGDGDVVVEGEGFAVSEELEGGYAGVKVPVEDCGFVAASMTGSGLTWKKSSKT